MHWSSSVGPPFGILEQTKTGAQEHGHDVNVEFIGQPGPQALLRGACCADHCNVFFACSRPDLSDGAFYAIRHEGKS
jgi:hypothetical protein